MTMDPARQESRKSSRSAFRMPVTWSVRQGWTQLVDDGELRDVTAEGAFLHLYCITTHPLWPGTRIRLTMHSPSGEIRTTGRVRWTGLHPAYENVPGIGIQFDEPQPALAAR
jgi:hypothetical protein